MELIFIEGTLNGRNFTENTFHGEILDFFGQHPDVFGFMQDNARTHFSVFIAVKQLKPN